MEKGSFKHNKKSEGFKFILGIWTLFYLLFIGLNMVYMRFIISSLDNQIFRFKNPHTTNYQSNYKQVILSPRIV